MSPTERAREIAERLRRNATSVRALIGEARFSSNQEHYRTCTDPDHGGCHERALVCDALDAADLLAAPVVPDPPTWSHRVDTDCEEAFPAGAGCIVCEVKQLRAALQQRKDA